MSIVPLLKAREIIQILLRAGFKVIRTRGSHFRLEHSLTKRKVSVAFRPGDVPRKTLLSILKQAGIALEEFLKMLGK